MGLGLIVRKTVPALPSKPGVIDPERIHIHPPRPTNSTLRSARWVGKWVCRRVMCPNRSTRPILGRQTSSREDAYGLRLTTLQ